LFESNALRLTAPRRSSFKGQNWRDAAWNIASRLLSCVTWLKRYEWRTRLAKDVAAGVAVTFLIVPQGLSYAGIAGLPAIYGLCASLLCAPQQREACAV
jgi:hypothetical protein